MEKQQIERVKQEMDQQRLKLEHEMEGAMFDFQAEQIRAGKSQGHCVYWHIGNLGKYLKSRDWEGHVPCASPKQ